MREEDHRGPAELQQRSRSTGHVDRGARLHAVKSALGAPAKIFYIYIYIYILALQYTGCTALLALDRLWIIDNLWPLHHSPHPKVYLDKSFKMDLGRDILRLAEKVANVPGLSMAFSLAMEIIKTVQASNTLVCLI